MRSGWQQTPAQGEWRHEPSGPEVSWPTGYYDLEPYQGGADVRPAGEMPYGEHPYAAQGYDDFGYGDPGYSDPRYEGPASPYQAQDGRIGNQWSGAYPTLPGAANDPRYDDPRLDAFGTGSYSADSFDTDPGYGSSYDGPPSGGFPSGGFPSGGLPSGGFPSGGLPSGGFPSGGLPSGGFPSGGAVRGDETRYDMPAYNEQRFDETRFDMPAYAEPAPARGYDHDATRYDMPALSAPVIESGGFDIDVYRDPEFPDYASGTGPQPAVPFGQPMRREQVLPHTGMMLAVPPELEAPPALDAFDTGILEKTGAFDAVLDAGPDAFAGNRDSVTDTMLDMQGAALLDEFRTQQAPEAPLQETPDPAVKRTGKRRSGSRDRRQWMAIGAVVCVAAGAVAGIVKFAFPSSNGPAHTMVTPSAVGAYTNKPDLEQQMGIPALVDKVRNMSNGQATDLVSGVYQAGSVSPGSTAQIFLFIGGHLNNADPAASISSFESEYPAAKVVSAGPMGGEAACVEVKAGTQGNAAECIWFDNDSFGQMVSSTMNTSTLQQVMTSVRPNFERVAK
jgi:hypothetical protein